MSRYSGSVRCLASRCNWWSECGSKDGSWEHSHDLGPPVALGGEMSLAPQLPWGVRKVRQGRTRTITIGVEATRGSHVLARDCHGPAVWFLITSPQNTRALQLHCAPPRHTGPWWSGTHVPPSALAAFRRRVQSCHPAQKASDWHLSEPVQTAEQQNNRTTAQQHISTAQQHSS